MKFPVIAVPEGNVVFPFIVSSFDPFFFQAPWMLFKSSQDMRKARIYALEGMYKIASVSSERKVNLWNRLFHGNDPAYWNVQTELAFVGDYELTELKEAILKSIDKFGDDVWDQFHEAAVVKRLFRECQTLAEIMAVGCLVGSWTPNPGTNNSHLPDLHYDYEEYDETMTEEAYLSNPDYHGALNRQSIETAAREIVFQECPVCVTKV